MRITKGRRYIVMNDEEGTVVVTPGPIDPGDTSNPDQF